MRKIVSCLAMALAAASVMGLPSCSSDSKPEQKADQQKRGSLSLALEATSDSGKVYRLRQAVFFVDSGFFSGGVSTSSGSSVAFADASVGVAGGATGTGSAPPFPTFDGGFGGFTSSGGATGIGGSPFPIPTPGGSTVVLNSEDDPTNPVLETFLVPSFYTIQLVPGWFVEQVDNLLHTATPVQAQLVSDSFQFFNIESNKETVVAFDFLVNGERVSFGDPGRLIVKINVHEQNGNSFCGNGVIDPGESCDGFDFGGQTCASVTFNSLPFGFLQCTKDCFFDVSQCFNNGFPEGGAGGATGTGGAPGTGGGPSPGDGGPVGDVDSGVVPPPKGNGNGGKK